MTWHNDPKWLWLIIMALLTAVVALVGLRVTESDAPTTSRHTRAVEVRSEACRRAVEAGENVALASGTALYVAPDFPGLVRQALDSPAGDERKNLLAQLRAAASGLRKARSFSESGDPPAWWRFDRWGARCLGETAPSIRYKPSVGNEDDLRRTIRRFMDARVRGRGAERFIESDGHDEFGRGGGLAPLYPRPPLQDFAIVHVSEPLDGPYYEVGVELVFARGSYGDTLFVTFDGFRYRITGGRPGLEGP